jgi:DNA-binding transcriptional regulator YiaG
VARLAISVAATAATTDTGTIALADQLNHLRERVPLSEEDVMAATGADEATVKGWVERRIAPAGEPAVRLIELIAVCERLTVSTKPEVIPEWLHRKVPLLGGRTSLATLASGGYEQVAGIAEDFIDPSFT